MKDKDVVCNRIIDKQLIHFLKGHKAKVSVMKYFIKYNRYRSIYFPSPANKS